jgi:sugar lactone lactonase YvrE
MTLPVKCRRIISIAFLALSAAAIFAHPGSGIVVDKSGQVFFTDTGRGVWKIDAQGRLTYVPAQRFHWLALDASGHFSTSAKNFGGYFERVTPQGASPALLMCSDFPLTVHADGNLYYADTRPSQKRIMRRAPDGKESVVARGDSYDSVTGIASGYDGAIYFTEGGAGGTNAIRKIAPDGAVTTIAADFVRTDSATVPPPEDRATSCRGLCVDSSGTVFVAATGSRSVVKIARGGRADVILREELPWSPTGVTVFRGEVYVLEWRDAPPSELETRTAWIPRVRKIAADGTVTTIATVTREPSR